MDRARSTAAGLGRAWATPLASIALGIARSSRSPFRPVLRTRHVLYVKKHAVVLTLTLLELVALVLLAFFGMVMRPDLAATYGLGEG